MSFCGAFNLYRYVAAALLVARLPVDVPLLGGRAGAVRPSTRAVLFGGRRGPSGRPSTSPRRPVAPTSLVVRSSTARLNREFFIARASVGGGDGGPAVPSRSSPNSRKKSRGAARENARPAGRKSCDAQLDDRAAQTKMAASFLAP